VDSEEFREIALSHLTPQYPIEARRRHIAGKVLYHLHVSLDTGEVTSVDVLTTTGHRILDRAPVAALKQWKFRRYAPIGVKIPITFSMPSKT
jgi:TonB family protein